MKKILFLHRSVGENLIRDGKMYELIATHGDDELSDFNQNTRVLRDADGSRKTDMVMPGGNTTPRDFAALFRDDYHSPLKDLTMEFDAIVIKSCYPNSNIKSSDELHEVQNYYRSIAQYLTQHADKKLIILTSPPLIPLLTNRANATRARDSTSLQTTAARKPTCYDANTAACCHLILTQTNSHHKLLRHD